MTLTMGLRFRNPDSSQDINSRLKDVANKGFVTGARVTPVSGRVVDVSPFACITAEGAVVRSDEVIRLDDLTTDQVYYVVLLAKYQQFASPELSVFSLTESGFYTNPNIDFLHVICTIDLTSDPADITEEHIAYFNKPSLARVDRDEVDPQTHNFFRGPVATEGNLPKVSNANVSNNTVNAHGDVRLVTERGSFYWWNAETQLWELFDEVPLNNHRSTEHSSGITGASDPSTTLFPSTVTEAGVPKVRISSIGTGAYTLEGRFVQSPNTESKIAISSAGGFPQRGLLQAYINELGVVAVGYRVEHGGGNVNLSELRIVNISDNHPIGTYSLHAAGNSIDWASGEPATLPEPQGTVRLYTAAYDGWIDVKRTGSSPVSSTDNYFVRQIEKSLVVPEVEAPSDKMLLAYYFWDRTSILEKTLDARYFGNVSYKEIASDFKDHHEAPPLGDLRGDAIFGGGDCEAASATMLRVKGPVVAYVHGRRFTPKVRVGSEDGFTGITLGLNKTHFIYVSEAGVLSRTSFDGDVADWPAGTKPEHLAEIARVVVNGTQIVTPIEDRRKPALVVGNPHGRTSLTWSVADKRLSLEDSEATAGTELEVGTLRLSDSAVIGIGAQGLTFEDANTPAPQALTAPGFSDLSVLQPLNAAPSIMGTLSDAQAYARSGLGVESGCGLTFNGNILTINPGIFNDPFGRRVTLSSPVDVTISGVSNPQVVKWNAGTATFVPASPGSAIWRSDLPFALVKWNGAQITEVIDIRMFTGGHNAASEFTVGQGKANFNNLKSAFAFRACFGSDQEIPKLFTVVNDLTGHPAVDLTDATVFPFADRLRGLQVVGRDETSSNLGSRPVIRWGATGQPSSTPLFTFNNNFANLKFENLRFEHAGTGQNPKNFDTCLFKNPGAGFQVENCTFTRVSGTGDGLACVVRLHEVTSLGGDLAGANLAMRFSKCLFTDSMGTGGDGVIIAYTNTSAFKGRLIFDGCTVNNPAIGYAGLFGYTNAAISTTNCQVDVEVNGGSIADYSTAVFISAGADDARSHNIQNANLKPGSETAKISQSPGHVLVSGCTFHSSGSLAGALIVTGCSGAGGESTVVSGDKANVISSCDFRTACRFDGAFQKISNSKVALPPDSPGLDMDQNSDYVVHGCDFIRTFDDASGVLDHQFLTVRDNARVRVTDCTFTSSGKSPKDSPMFEVTGSNIDFTMKGCKVNVLPLPAQTIAGDCIKLSATGDNFRVVVHDNELQTQTGSVINGTTSTGTAKTTVRIHDNRLEQIGVGEGGRYAIDFPGDVSGKRFERLNFVNNTVALSSSSQNNVIRVQRVAEATVDGNNWQVPSANPIFLLGSLSGSDFVSSSPTSQRSLSFSSNRVFVSNAVAGYVAISVGGYTNNVVNRNEVTKNLSANTGSDSSISLVVSLPSETPNAPSAQVSNNTLVISNKNASTSTLPEMLAQIVVEGGVGADVSPVSSVTGNIVMAKTTNKAVTKTKILVSDLSSATVDGNCLTSITKGNGEEAKIEVSGNVNGTASGNRLVTSPNNNTSIASELLNQSYVRKSLDLNANNGQNHSLNLDDGVYFAIDSNHGENFINGIVAPANRVIKDQERYIIITNTGPSFLTLRNEAAQEAVLSNRILTGINDNGNTGISLTQNGSVQMIYDRTAGRWRVISVIHAKTPAVGGP